MNKYLSSTLSLLMSALIACTGSPILHGQDAPKLKILIIEGEGATNNIKQRTAREPIVEVLDENNRPVGGAIVTFTAPNYGASGTFQGGSKLFTVTTDSNGRATARGFQPNSAKGQLKLQVRAQSNGQSASSEINMTNVGAGGGAGMSTSAKWWTVVAVGAGAAIAGGVLGTRGSSTTPPSTTTISAGPGTVIGR